MLFYRNLEELSFDDMNWIELACDMVKWLAFVLTEDLTVT
jgi:hypothetical protein